MKYFIEEDISITKDNRKRILVEESLALYEDSEMKNFGLIEEVLVKELMKLAMSYTC